MEVRNNPFEKVRNKRNHQSLGHLGPSVGSEKVSCGWKDGKMDGGWRQAADGICEENCKNFGENPLALSS